MSRTIPAIFDAGVFRPLEPVELAQGTQVELQLSLAEPTITSDNDALDTNSWLEYVNRMESLPDNSPKDGFSNRDHDRIIYGG
jgi:predicted DNA-binding antitoxin AbrB/MazE fold protein